MKVTPEKLDTNLPIDVTVENPGFLNQTAPFTISGVDYETATSYIQAVESMPVPKTRNVASTAIKAAENAPEALTGIRASVAAKLFDLANGTDLYGMLAEKRRDERSLAMAQTLGLVSTTHCAKHQKALAQLKRIV